MINGILSSVVSGLWVGLQGLLKQEGTLLATSVLRYREELQRNPLRVFMAHDKRDAKKVRELYDKLISKKDFKPWFDEEELKHINRDDRDLVDKTIGEGIEKCECGIVCMSWRSIYNKRYLNQIEVPAILSRSRGTTELSRYMLLEVISKPF